MDAIALIGRLILALAVVLGVMWAIARVAQKRGRGSRKGQALTVLARQSLGKNSSIAVVRVMDRAMVVGVTDGNVTLLGDTDLEAVQELADAPRPSARIRAREDVDLGSLEPGAQLSPVGPDPSRRAARAARPARSERPARSRRTARTRPEVAPAGGALAGSALSVGTWKQAVEAVREKTVRRA